MNIILNGANGRMGRIVDEAVAQGGEHAVAARVDWSYAAGDGLSELAQYEGPADVVIDFSNHAATAQVTEYCVERGLPVVIATTGQTEEELALIRAAAERIPVFLSANMSLGVALLADLARRAAAAFPKADIEIIIATGSETITLKHEAENRALFAQGALAAAAFIVGKAPGFYDMRSIIE